MAGKNKKPSKKKSPATKKAAKPSAKPAAKKKVVAKAAAKPAKKAKKVAVKAAKPVKAEKPSKVAVKGKAVPAPEPKGKGKKGQEKPDAIVESVALAAPVTPEDEEVILTDSEGRRYCRVKDCDQLSTVDGYCRYHYLLHWKKIQIRKKILSEGKLERYIEDLTARYPDKFLDMLRKDLRSEKEFLAAIAELEIDESAVDNEFEDETQNYLDEVRGMSSETPTASGDDDF